MKLLVVASGAVASAALRSANAPHGEPDRRTLVRKGSFVDGYSCSESHKKYLNTLSLDVFNDRIAQFDADAKAFESALASENQLVSQHPVTREWEVCEDTFELPEHYKCSWLATTPDHWMRYMRCCQCEDTRDGSYVTVRQVRTVLSSR